MDEAGGLLEPRSLEAVCTQQVLITKGKRRWLRGGGNRERRQKGRGEELSYINKVAK